ncbi:MAG: hypothetical protein JKX69_14455 [Rhodobacteraceae bacterium]|nr:hypothetical protein [Paracoccaceae bacterium]
MVTIVRAAATVGGLLLAQGAAAQSALPNCEAYPTGESVYACLCPTGDGAGSVWGSGPFTGDSNICAAALHAGVISTSGGAVLALAAGAQEGFVGSEANGVTSRGWGAYGNSFGFNPKGPRSVAQVDTGVAACAGLPSASDGVTCSCTGAESGGIWGADPFTADSDLCTAARFAGYIGEAGGVITVLRIAGLESYLGTESNGITSNDWGSYGDSITFDWNQ